MFSRRQLFPLCLLAPLSLKAAIPKRRPVVLDALFYPNSPLPSSFGALRLPLAYESNSNGGAGMKDSFWRPSDADQNAMPTQERVSSVLAGYQKYTGIICLDVERWNNWGSGGVAAAKVALQRYRDLLSMCRIACPLARFGYYNMAPTDYSNKYFVAAHSSPVLASVRMQNDIFAPLTEAQDVLFPCAYTVSLQLSHWLTYVQVVTNECNRLAPNKPRYFFLCPTYLNIQGYEQVFVDAKVFRSEMEYCVANGDGFALWGGHDVRKIDFSSEWWIALKDVIAHLGSY